MKKPNVKRVPVVEETTEFKALCDRDRAEGDTFLSGLFYNMFSRKNPDVEELHSIIIGSLDH